MAETMHVRPFAREAGWDLPASLDGLIPPDHPVRFVAQYVDGLDAQEWQELGISWEEGGPGSHGYHPRVLLGAWLWGFMTGTRSSRRLEAACAEQISALWLTGGQRPDHNTLWRFYQAHRAGMRYLLTDTVRLAVRVGLVDLAVQAVDGTKVPGNAARDRSYDRQGLDRLYERCARAIADLEAQNETGGDPPPPRLPAPLQDPARLAAAIRQARQRLPEQGTSRINLTDADARIMPSRHGYIAGYNAEAAVVGLDAAVAGRTGQLVVAADLAAGPDDYAQLAPMLDQSAATTGVRIPRALADGGYLSVEALQAADARQQEVLLPVDAPAATATEHPYHQRHFVYDQEHDQYVCPEGQVLPFARITQRAGRLPMRVYRAGVRVCRACPAFGRCTTDQRKGRVLEVTAPHPRLQAHRALMATAEAQAAYARRKELIEPVFGIMKEEQGLRRFLLRGKDAVRAEWTLLATSFNLRTLARIWQARPGLLAPSLQRGGR
jgi:transposase